MKQKRLEELTMDNIRQLVKSCKQCGEGFGNSAVGFGKEDNPLIFFIGLNPKVKNHTFDDGRGITILKEKLKEWKFDDFFLDNVIKCEIPGLNKLGGKRIDNCFVYLSYQIEILNPKAIVCFGHYSNKQMLRKYGTRNLYEWWDSQDILFHEEPIPFYSVPHFSAPLYGGNSISLEEYYKKLEVVINEIKRKYK